MIRLDSASNGGVKTVKAVKAVKKVKQQRSLPSASLRASSRLGMTNSGGPSNRVKTKSATDSRRFRTGKALKSGRMGGGTRSDGVVEDVLFAARMAAGSGTELTADPLEFVRTSESISYALRESISRTEARFRRAGRPGVVEWWSDGDGGMVHGSGFGVHGWGLNSHRQRRLCHRGRQSGPDLAPEKHPKSTRKGFGVKIRGKDSGQGVGVNIQRSTGRRERYKC